MDIKILRPLRLIIKLFLNAVVGAALFFIKQQPQKTKKTRQPANIVTAPRILVFAIAFFTLTV